VGAVKLLGGKTATIPAPTQVGVVQVAAGVGAILIAKRSGE
jgi:hypothetical protein